MADVNVDRGQLILVAALGLAVLFVTLALVMNTVIYTENLATRSSQMAGGTEADSFHVAAEAGVAGLITYANYHNGSSHDDLYRNVTTGIERWENATGNLYAQSGVAIEIALQSAENGTRIAQDDARNFTGGTGATAWTVAEDVDRTRGFRINVTDETALRGPGTGNEFEIVASDGIDEWRLNITRDGTGTVIGILTEDDEFACSASDRPRINISEGTVDGEPCPGLRFPEGVTGQYLIEYGNADNVTGTYELVVTNASLAADPGPHLNADGSDPYATPAIYSVDIRITYQTPRLVLRTEPTVTPGEADG